MAADPRLRGRHFLGAGVPLDHSCELLDVARPRALTADAMVGRRWVLVDGAPAAIGGARDAPDVLGADRGGGFGKSGHGCTFAPASDILEVNGCPRIARVA